MPPDAFKTKQGDAGQQVYQFLWDEYADWFIEASKTRMADPRSAQRTLVYIPPTYPRTYLHSYPTYPTNVVGRFEDRAWYLQT